MTERDIFLVAVELTDPAARAAYLDRVCGPDADLRRRVGELLGSHEAAGSFLGTPAVAAAGPGAATLGFEPAPGPAGGESPFGFLGPSTRPGSLGRIGRYEVLQVLGRGGFGIVFRAFDDALERVVAVKVLGPETAATSPARKRFLREARASAQVRHENVVQVYEVGEEPLPYIAMEFIPGETLQQRIDRTGPLDAAEVARVGRQVAEGLAAAHAQDLIHRDIKPGNVLIEGGTQRAKITDFGLARAADDADRSASGLLAGTPMYMAPEQATGDNLDHRADLFSLGSVLYQMATGRPPFRANSTLAVLKRVAEDTPRPVREVIPETPRWLCEVIAKLHAKNPDDRFQSARDVSDALAAGDARPRAAAGPGRPPGADPGRRRRWKWAAAAALLLPAVALVAAEAAGVTRLFPGRGAAVNQPPRDAAALPPTFTSATGLEFVKIPKGAGWLGGANDFPGTTAVTIPADFYLGRYEVTQEEWEKVMGQNPSRFSRGGGGKDAVKDIPDAELKRFPVEQVSWEECQVFLKELNRAEPDAGWVYRLPKEAEWEYACRGGPGERADSAFDFYFAAPTNVLAAGQANFETGDGLKRPRRVGSYPPNALGLHDMHGNVWEWCDDTAPTAPDDLNRILHRVYRGGSCYYGPGYCRASHRETATPSYWSHGFGLRVARVPAAGGSDTGSD